jgi:hypothetical protein
MQKEIFLCMGYFVKNTIKFHNCLFDLTDQQCISNEKCWLSCWYFGYSNILIAISNQIQESIAIIE